MDNPYENFFYFVRQYIGALRAECVLDDKDYEAFIEPIVREIERIEDAK